MEDFLYGRDINQIDIRSLEYDELKALMTSWGEKSYRADQIFTAIHSGRADSFEEIPVIPGNLREKLKRGAYFPGIKTVQTSRSDSGDTVKFAFALDDGNIIESVVMEYSYGLSLCISSQVGCRMGCRFCASTLDGVERNLTASEMLLQVLAAEREMGRFQVLAKSQPDSSAHISRIVIMGMGEPMDNLDNVIRFLRIITHPKGRDMSPRDITLSTCGLVPQIRRLADCGIPVNLALSLHAADDETRKKLMPVANAYTVRQCLEACDYYFDKTGRRISYEYALFDNINDTPDAARRLASLLRGRNCHVNLIRANSVKETKLKGSSREKAITFKKELEKCGINVTIRRRMGRTVDGACGQLRRRVIRPGLVPGERTQKRS